jgi:uncharacterized protein YggT (Ycf19 family)
MVLAILDFILNLAGLLLWLNWRSLRFDPLVRTSAASLAGTLRRAEPPRVKGWQVLGGLGLLTLVRAWFYWEVGSAISWSPKLDLGVVVLGLRSAVLRVDYFRTALLFSVLSLGRTLLVFYFWLLALVVLNRRLPDSEPVQKTLRLHVGRVARWPWPVQVLLPLVVAGGLWLALQPLLVHAGVLNRVSSKAHLAGQALLVGGALYVSLKYVLPVFLLLYLVASYVYLGSSRVWDFVGATARNLLAPLRSVPMRVGRCDFAPLVATVLILLLFYWPLPDTLRWWLARHHLALWPQ